MFEKNTALYVYKNKLELNKVDENAVKQGFLIVRRNKVKNECFQSNKLIIFTILGIMLEISKEYIDKYVSLVGVLY